MSELPLDLLKRGYPNHFVAGVPGQELLEARPAAVLPSCVQPRTTATASRRE
ncbi:MULTISPECIES: hypothetical protein [unclassified Streptomyces]|uniref:hypothetical protein n=1 Tax=unclassified Streptomyces TaxID=2593676 RepID=UPI003425564B